MKGNVNNLIKINNLIKYFVELFAGNDKDTKFCDILNKDTVVLEESDFKQQLFKCTKLDSQEYWMDPVDLLILSINTIEKIKDKINLKNCNKFSLLWIVCILNTKFMSSHDYQHDISLLYWSNFVGLEVKEYDNLEKEILRIIDWKLDITKPDYDRLFIIAVTD